MCPAARPPSRGGRKAEKKVEKGGWEAGSAKGKVEAGTVVPHRRPSPSTVCCGKHLSDLGKWEPACERGFSGLRCVTPRQA